MQVNVRDHEQMCFVLLTVAGDKDKKKRLKEEEQSRQIKEKLEKREESLHVVRLERREAALSCSEWAAFTEGKFEEDLKRKN